MTASRPDPVKNFAALAAGIALLVVVLATVFGVPAPSAHAQRHMRAPQMEHRDYDLTTTAVEIRTLSGAAHESYACQVDVDATGIVYVGGPTVTTTSTGLEVTPGMPPFGAPATGEWMRASAGTIEVHCRFTVLGY